MKDDEQRRSNLYRFLSYPRIFTLFQSLFAKKGVVDLIVERYIKPFPGARIMDLGCGPAAILERLPSFVEYHGYDSNSEYIADAREKYKERGHFHLVDFNSEHYELPGPELKYDIVLMLGVLHHLSDGAARKVLATAKCHMNYGGGLFCWDPVLSEHLKFFARWLAAHDRGRYVRTEKKHMDLFVESWPEIAHEVRSDFSRVPSYSTILAYTESDLNKDD